MARVSWIKATLPWWRRLLQSRWLQPGLVAALAALALWLRWDRLAYTELTPDQSWSYARALDFVQQGDFPLAGIPSSALTRQGPIEIYLLALPALFSSDPLWGAALIGLMGAGAVVAAYLFTSRHFGVAAGLSAALLFAVNPWALHYARKIWTPNALPLFTVLFFAALFAAVREGKRYQFSLACFWLAVMIFTHPQSIGFVPILLVGFLLRWRQFLWRPLLLGAALAFLVALPYGLYLWETSFVDLPRFLNAAGNSTSSLVWPPLSLQYVVGMASAAMFPEILDFTFRSPAALPDLTVLNVVASGLFLLGCGLCVGRLIAAVRSPSRREGWQVFLFLLLWPLLPVALYMQRTSSLWPHYFIYVLPAQYVLMGVAVGWLGRVVARRWHLAPVLVGAGVLSLALGQVVFFESYLGAVEHLGPGRPYGTPLVFQQQALATVRQLRVELGEIDVTSYGFLHRETLDFLARPDVSFRHVDRPFSVVLPRDPAGGQLAMLCGDDAAHAMYFDYDANRGSAIRRYHDFYATQDDGPIVPQLRGLGFTELPERNILGPDGFVYYRFFYLPAERVQTAYAAFAPPPAALVLTNGMRLVGYDLPTRPQADGMLRLRLLWDLPPKRAAYPYAEHNLFAHISDGHGRVVAQRDWELLQYLDWRVDGLLLTEHELTLPAGGPALRWLDLGAYERFGRQPVAWRGGDGHVVGDALKVGPFKVAPPQVAAAAGVRVDHRFGDWLQLLGYDLSPTAPQRGGALDLTLHWRALSPPPGDWIVSVQLLDAAGRLLAQHDAPPAAGEYPTHAWEAGEQVPDHHGLLLPANLPSGTYYLHLVLYASAGGQRLPVEGGDSLRLTALTVP
ncbi:MAG: ArnT family glycosyltransferase [Chloroflexota bacterium]